MPVPPRRSTGPPVSSQLQPPQPEDFSILLSRLQVAHEHQVAELQWQIHVLNDLLKNKSTHPALPLNPLAPHTPVADASSPAPSSNPSLAPVANNLPTTRVNFRLTKCQSQESVDLDVRDANNGKRYLSEFQLQEAVGLNLPYDNDARKQVPNSKSTVSGKSSVTWVDEHSSGKSVISKDIFPALYVQQSREKQRMVESPYFESFSMLMIFLNTITMLVQAQYEGIDVGYSLEVDGYSKPKEDAWPYVGAVLEVAERCFIIFFTFELILRIVSHGLQFFKGFYHVLDFVIVLAGWLDWAAGDAFDPTMLRLLRFVRIGRIMRSFSNPRFLDALYFLMTSIKSSMSTLTWSLVVILIIQCIAALTICQLLYGWFEGASSSPESREVFLYYGNFSRAVLTMFEILLANWIVPCRVLSNHVGEIAGLLMLSYRCICGFAVLNTISAVFINQTMKCMSQDSDVMLIERARVEKKFRANLYKLFDLLDVSHDGKITRLEFTTRLMDPDVHMACFSMGMSIHELEGIVDLCDLGDGEGMSIELFIQAAHDIRKQANTLDVARLLVYSRNVHTCVKRIKKDFDRIADLVQTSFDRDGACSGGAKKII